MTADELIARMRTRQADLFDSTVAVARRSGNPTFNETTASYGAPPETTVYTGPGLVRPKAYTVDQAGEVSQAVDTYEIKVPVDTDIAIGDAVDVTASTHDDGLVGLTLRVTDVPVNEWQVARRFTAVRETERPT